MQTWPERSSRWTRLQWAAAAASVAVHSLLLLVVIRGWLPRLQDRTRATYLIPVPGPAPYQIAPSPYHLPRRHPLAGTAPVRRRPPPALPVDTVLPPPAAAPRRDAPPEPTPVPRGPVGRIGPGPGDGRLWVRPLPLPPKELAHRLERTHAELVDSAVTAIVQAYLDSVAREPGAERVKMPDWTTRVAGAKFGLDSRYLYIAGLKIPAAVLALLPIPATGNQQRALDHNSAWIAEDLSRAAQRAVTVDEFKRAVRELRAEKQRQKDLERAQREKPDTTTARTGPPAFP